MREMEIVTLGAADGLVGPKPVPKGDAEEGVKHAAVHTECLNCGAALHGRYCASCGQPDDDHHRSIFHLLWEAVEGLTHLDGRLAKTLPPLFLNPGKLARDHFEGRRQRHVPPFRLFLITLLVFMFSLEFVFPHSGFGGKTDVPGVAGVPKLGQSFVAKNAHGETVTVHMPSASDISNMTGGQVSADEVQRRVDAQRAQALLHPAGSKTGAPESDKDADGDDDQPVVPAPDTPKSTTPAGPVFTTGSAQRDRALHVNWWKQRMVKIRDNPELFKSLVFEWGHRLAVLLLPIFALLLTACYFYKRQFYVYDHLVVAMHFLSFTFLLWAVVYLVPEPAKDWLMLIAFFWTPVNLFMALRGAYGSSWFGAGVKAFGLWIATQVLFLGMLLGVLGVAVGQL